MHHYNFKQTLCFTILLTLILAVCSYAAESDRKNIKVGQCFYITSAKKLSYQVSDSEVIKTGRISGSKIRITGTKPGTSSITCSIGKIKKVYIVHVSNKKTDTRKRYVIDKDKFRQFVLSHNPKVISFKKSVSNTGGGTDLSEAKDRSVLCKMSGKYMYIYTQTKGAKPRIADGKLFFSGLPVEKIELSCIDTTGMNDMTGMFMDCNRLKTVTGMSNINSSKVRSFYALFENCTHLTEIDLSKMNTGNVETLTYMFKGCKNLVTIRGLETWNTKNVTSMEGAFACGDNLTGNAKLKNLDVSKFNTTKVKNMDDLFYGCGAIQYLDVSNWNVSNVVSLDHTFCNLFSLKKLDVSKWNPYKCVDFNACFHDLHEVKELDVSRWNTSSGIYFCQMFEGCLKLKNLDLKNFNTSNAIGFSEMFSRCNSLKTLNLCSFSIRKVPSIEIDGEGAFSRCSAGMSNMFSNCTSLKTIYVNENWNLKDKACNGITSGCKAEFISNSKRKQ